MNDAKWEYCKVGDDLHMTGWRRAGNSLDFQLTLDDPPKFIAVSNSSCSAYNNSTLKYQLVQKTDEVTLTYKHFKEKHPPLMFRHIMTKALAVKVASAQANKVYMQIEVYSGMSGNFLTKLEVDREIRVSACKAAILNKLVKHNHCTPQTGLMFVDPADNNGSKKMTTILNFKDKPKPKAKPKKAAQPAQPAQSLKDGTRRMFDGVKKNQKQ